MQSCRRPKTDTLTSSPFALKSAPVLASRPPFGFKKNRAAARRERSAVFDLQLLRESCGREQVEAIVYAEAVHQSAP
jgi:hypothetical protein